MKKKVFFIIAIILVFISATILFIFMNNEGEKLSFEGYYKYPDTSNMSAVSILSACRISSDILESMTDEQLAQAVIDFPLLIDVGALSSFEFGVECLPKNSDAYKELLTREGAKDALLSKYKELKEKEEKTEGEQVSEYLLQIVILYEKEFEGAFSEEELEYLQENHTASSFKNEDSEFQTDGDVPVSVYYDNVSYTFSGTVIKELPADYYYAGDINKVGEFEGQNDLEGNIEGEVFISDEDRSIVYVKSSVFVLIDGELSYAKFTIPLSVD